MYITDRHKGETYELDPHQKEALQHLRDNPRAGLFLEMSLSKTVISLLYLYEMTYKECAICKTLVIAPDKVARLTWPDEVNKWAEISDFRYSVIQGTPKQRLEALNADADIFFIGVDNVSWLIDQYIYQRVSKNTGLPYGEWLGKLPFDCVVIDESSTFKNWSSNRYIKLRRAFDKSNVDYRILLTGTPATNGEIDLWAQINLLADGQRLGHTVGSFIDKYITTRGNGMVIHEYITKKGAAKVISKKIADIVLSMQTRDYMELPELILDDQELSLSDFDKEVYDELEREYFLDFESGDSVTVKTPADLVNKLLQVSSGAVYEDKNPDEKTRVWHELNTLKMDALEEVRSTERQQQLYAQGRTVKGVKVTNADGVRKKSNHQAKADGYGHAVDLYPFVDGKVRITEPYVIHNLRTIADHVKKHAKRLGIKLTWGGDWKSPFDPPHFQIET